MFERFTERAREVVVLAQQAARDLKHNGIGTEHILLGLLREREGLAAQALESLGISYEDALEKLVWIVGSGEEVTSGQIPFTPRAKKILELALREALAFGHNYVGTEHLLLGLVRENEGVATRILLEFDADSEKIRTTLIGILPGPDDQPHSSATARPRAADVRLVVSADPEVRRLLMAAGGRALADGRNEFGLSDLLAVATEIQDQLTPSDTETQEPKE